VIPDIIFRCYTDTTWPQRKTTTKEHLEKRSGDVDSRIQVQLEEDGGGSTEQN